MKTMDEAIREAQKELDRALYQLGRLPPRYQLPVSLETHRQSGEHYAEDICREDHTGRR